MFAMPMKLKIICSLVFIAEWFNFLIILFYIPLTTKNVEELIIISVLTFISSKNKFFGKIRIKKNTLNLFI